MKRFLAYFCCIFTLLGQSFSCLANDNIVGSTEAGNILYQDSAIILRANSNMSVVECENLSTGTREVAYWEENHVVDRWYENEVLISEKVFDKSSFISEETALDDSLMNSIDKALAEIADKDLTSEMVYNKLMESGIQCTVTAVPDGFIIDPIINNMISTNAATELVTLDLQELMAAFPPYNKTVIGQTNFNSALNGTVKTMSCKFTRNSYVVSKRQIFNISSGTGLAAAAVMVMIHPDKLASLCKLYISIGTFIKNVAINRATTAYASALGQAYTYDETNYHREVSVHSEYGKDYYAVGKYADYAPYGWAATSSFLDTYSASYIIQQGIAVWNNNMIYHGYWQWGDV